MWVKPTKDTSSHPHIGHWSSSYKGQRLHTRCCKVIHPYAQISMPMSSISKSKYYHARLKFIVKILILILRSRSGMYATHRASWWYTPVPNIEWLYQRTKKLWSEQRHVINPINVTLRSKFKVESGSWMYVKHPLIVIDACAKYCKPMQNQKNSYWPDTKTCQKPNKCDIKVKGQDECTWHILL